MLIYRWTQSCVQSADADVKPRQVEFHVWVQCVGWLWSVGWHGLDEEGGHRRQLEKNMGGASRLVQINGWTLSSWTMNHWCHTFVTVVGAVCCRLTNIAVNALVSSALAERRCADLAAGSHDVMCIRQTAMTANLELPLEKVSISCWEEFYQMNSAGCLMTGICSKVNKDQLFVFAVCVSVSGRAVWFDTAGLSRRIICVERTSTQISAVLRAERRKTIFTITDMKWVHSTTFWTRCIKGPSCVMKGQQCCALPSKSMSSVAHINTNTALCHF